MMFGTLAAAAALALAPSQAGSLNLTNVRTTYGELGAVRTDNKFLPGDLYFLAFDIEGITIGQDGKVSYSMTVAVTDKAGKAILKSDKPVESDEYLPLGGNRLPARAFVLLKRDQEPGTYTCKVSVTDRATRVTKDLVRSFDVVPKTFGLIALVTSYDVDGQLPAPPSGVVGQNLFIHGALLGFGRGRDKKPNATVELRIYDEAKRPTLAKPLTALVPAELPETEDFVTVRFLVPFNREGSFTAELKATDNVSGKTASASFPIKVSPSAK
jgi:hypothetical protein